MTQIQPPQNIHVRKIKTMQPEAIRNKNFEEKEYEEKLHTFHTCTQQDQTAKGVTLQHFGQTTL